MTNYTAALFALDDSDLDVYQSRVWLRVLRRGVCFESQRSMARSMSISLAQVNRTVKWLLENGWIVKAIDQKTSKMGYSAVIPGEQVQQESVIPGEHVIPQERFVIREERGVIPQERHLKETIKETNKENIYMQADLVSDYITELSGISKERLAPGFNEQKFEDAAHALIGWGADIYRIEGFSDYWKQNGWHNNKPALTNIVNHWHDYLAGKDLRDRHNGNGRSPSIPKPAPASERTPGAQ